MQFNISVSLEELLNMDVDLKGLIGTKDGIEQKNFKFSTLTKGKRGRKPKIKPESEANN